MKKINYGLIVSDYDGTLITSDQKILPEVKEAILEYVERGGIFAVCTGRMLCCILENVRKLGLKGLVVAYQGTMIADIESGKLIKNGGLDYREAVEVCKILEELNQPVNVYNGDVMYTTVPKDNEGLRLYEKIVGIDSISVNGKMSDFVENGKFLCQKVSVLVKKEERDGLYSKLLEKLGDRFDVTCSAKELVEVSPLDDNKGEGLKYIAEYYNIPIEKTVAVGDNLNDLSMIIKAGVGVAVGNADIKLKEVADFVTCSNNEGAIAKVINKYGFA